MLFGISSSSSDFESTSSRPKKRQQIKQQQLKLPYTASYTNNNTTTAASANKQNCFINVIESTPFDANKQTDKKFPKIPYLVADTHTDYLQVHNLPNTTNANTDRTAIVHKSKHCRFSNKTSQIPNVKCVKISENLTNDNLPDTVSKTIKTNRFYSSRLSGNLETADKAKAYISPHNVVNNCIRVTTIESNEFAGCKANCADVDAKVSDGKHLTFTNNKQFRLTDTEARTNSKPNLIISRRNQISKTKFLNDCGMDRSVDSIGSCSLDVDADSTDFSGI